MDELADANYPRWISFLDGIILKSGRIVAWGNFILIGVIVLTVVLRYALGIGSIVLEELQWHIYSFCFMIGLSYAVTMGSNIRIDLFYVRYSENAKQWMTIIEFVLLILPLVIVFTILGIDFFWDSWIYNERSVNPMGLPYRWIIKFVIPLSFSLLGLAAISHVAKAIILLREK